EGKLAVGRDLQVAYLVRDRSKGSEGFTPGSTLTLGPEVAERRRDIVGDEVGRVERHDAVDVLRADRLRQVLEALSDDGLGSLLLLGFSGSRHARLLRLSAHETRQPGRL